MQDNYEAPVTGHVRIDYEMAQAVSEFLMVILQIPDSPLNRQQMEHFAGFREVVKAGPEQMSRHKDKTSVLRDGIVLGDGPKCLFDRHIALGYLRAMIHGEMTPEFQKKLQVALLDAVASKGPKKNAGINGTFCKGTFGYTNAQAAADYLTGMNSDITVHRSKSRDRDFQVYFADSPNTLLRPDKRPWIGPKDHVKTKFTAEEMKNQ